jgi:eukaryotic-like serine/threonine-protein kinase
MKADWRRIEEVFLAALEKPAQDRDKFVANGCDGDEPLREEVLAMLRSHEETGDFLETPAYQENAALLAEQRGALKIGEQIGHYQILSLLGEGGMGEVYLAEDLSLGRKVAVKLVRPGSGGANLLRQFQREERILAGLTHPNIARLYGGAVTENGVPYFVMEFVEGERLDSFCDTHRLGIRERLELFRKICAAVSYAHRHLVIHRDLKPANIRVGADGEPKLLDFGIAKLLDDENVAVPEQTVTLSGAMTPDYASPEQLRGEPMTTATDVYSLGVILFELLTGTKPYRTKSRSINEVSRAITEQEPTRPSIVAASGGNPKSEFRNPKLLRGDLDNIVLTAIRKEPARRYSSVGQFSEDIRRHLDGLPIVARKDTVGYRATKFIQRNRIAVSAAGIVMLAIVGGLLVALWEARQARAQRDVARDINTFLQDMLGAAAPDAKGVNVKVVDVLSDASIRARSELARQPQVMADILMTLGRTYISLGLYQPAEANLRAALDVSLKANGELHSTTASTMGWLGLALANLGKTAEGEQISRKAVELQRKLHPKGHEDLGVALYALGCNLIYKNDPKAAQPYLEEASGLIKRHLGETTGYYMTTLVMLAMAHERAGEVDRAVPLYRQAIDVGGRAEARYRIYLAQAQALLGILLINKAAYSEAETLLQESETIYNEVLGGDGNYSVAVVKANLGWLYFLKGDYAKTESEDKKAIDLVRQYMGPENPLTASTAGTLGLTLTRDGKAAEGEPYLREALAIRKKILPPGDVSISSAVSALGECLTAQKRYDDAEPLLLQSYEELKAKSGDQDKRTTEARKRLAKLYEDWNKPEQAAQFR